MLKHIDPVECGEGTKFICQFCTTRLTKQQLNDKDNFKEQQQSIDKVESSDSNSEETLSNISYNEDLKFFEIDEKSMDNRRIERYQNENDSLKDELEKYKNEIKDLK